MSGIRFKFGLHFVGGMGRGCCQRGCSERTSVLSVICVIKRMLLQTVRSLIQFHGIELLWLTFCGVSLEACLFTRVQCLEVSSYICLLFLCLSLTRSLTDSAVVRNCSGSYVAGNGAKCSKSCGGGALTHIYRITSAALNGGLACPVANGTSKSVACNTIACRIYFILFASLPFCPFAHLPSHTCVCVSF